MLDVHLKENSVINTYEVRVTPTRADQCAKYEFASSNTTRTTFTFEACFV
jgi:hypothetical protein